MTSHAVSCIFIYIYEEIFSRPFFQEGNFARGRHMGKGKRERQMAFKGGCERGGMGGGEARAGDGGAERTIMRARRLLEAKESPRIWKKEGREEMGRESRKEKRREERKNRGKGKIKEEKKIDEGAWKMRSKILGAKLRKEGDR